MALKGIKVVEMAGLAPAPFCGMILSDFGAKVVRVDQARSQNPDRLSRGKQSIGVNLAHQSGRDVVRKLCNSSDVLIEPYRPGIMEKMGLGPKVLLGQNSRLIYARLTGYGQEGPLKEKAGHDINYLAMSGLLSRLGETSKPSPPINLLADLAGGGMSCALGILMALFQRTSTGKGQVIDASMVEGAAYIGSYIYRMLDSPVFTERRGEGWLDGGAPFYGTYETKDNKYMAVGALESQYYEKFIEGLGLQRDEASQFHDWNDLRRRITEAFKTRTQAEWCEIFEGVDACVTPVLSVAEAVSHPHNVHRKTFATEGQPRPAPRLTEGAGREEREGVFSPNTGEHTREVLKDLGYTEDEIQGLEEEGAVDVTSTSYIPFQALELIDTIPWDRLPE